MSNNDNHNPFSLIADFDGDMRSLFNMELDESLPILPLRNMTLFPGVVIPVTVGRKSSLRLVREANKNDKYIGVVCQLNPETEKPTYDDLYKIGTVAKVIRILELPDNSFTVLLQGFRRFMLESIDEQTPYVKGRVVGLDENVPNDEDQEFTALVDACKDLTVRYLKANENTRAEPIFAIRNISNRMFLVNFICTNLPFSIEEKNELLSQGDVKRRAYKLLSILNRENQYAVLKANIQNKTREDIDQQQKEYFLQQQLKNIQDELGDSSQNQEAKELKEKAAKKNMPEAVRKIFDKELSKLERLNPQSPDYNVQLNYLQVIVSLPWNTYTKDDLDIAHAAKILNRDHYGLDKIKQRILEHLAVLTLRKDLKSPIICLYGPPGVGKTSLGKSIADALKRKYVRMSLGGIHDEAEIRGHRRTYIGAMPGRIIKGLQKAGSSNPVFILDEIDKVTGNNINGDPLSALLEVLDPEQNNAFHDNYLDIDYDLSKVMFIATANTLSTIPRPLLDRMEVIEVSGYLTEEKIEIAKRHLVPKEKETTGIGKEHKVRFSNKALEFLIEHYTRESGVRQLERQINKMLRKIAYRIVSKEEPTYADSLLQPKEVETLLGKPMFNRDMYQGNQYAGVVTGLAWTSVGGEILFIETSLSKSHGGKLTLTGNLGDVMKESAMIALQYVRAHADDLHIDPRLFDQRTIHIHVPEGATPKDGPSAGITIATSIASALTQRKVRANLAMTGEITLRGKVLPVGGIKEKILAAKRAGITDILISEENKKDIEEIEPKYLEGVTFHYVNDVMQVLDFALLKEKVDHPADLSVTDEKNEKKDADK